MLREGPAGRSQRERNVLCAKEAQIRTTASPVCKDLQIGVSSNLVGRKILDLAMKVQILPPQPKIHAGMV